MLLWLPTKHPRHPRSFWSWALSSSSLLSRAPTKGRRSSVDPVKGRAQLSPQLRRGVPVRGHQPPRDQPLKHSWLSVERGVIPLGNQPTEVSLPVQGGPPIPAAAQYLRHQHQAEPFPGGPVEGLLAPTTLGNHQPAGNQTFRLVGQQQHGAGIPSTPQEVLDQHGELTRDCQVMVWPGQQMESQG